MNKYRTIEDKLYIVGLIFLILGVIGIPIYLHIVSVNSEIKCVFNSVLGLYCPGCGGTRAFLHLLHGRIITSFLFHPLVIYTAVVFFVFMISHTIRKISGGRVRGLKYRDVYLYIAVAIIFINWILKNALLIGWGIKFF